MNSYITTIDEATKIVKGHYQTQGWELLKNLKEVKEVLRLQIPKKVTTKCECPSCKVPAHAYQRYCYHCGQKLKWDEALTAKALSELKSIY